MPRRMWVAFMSDRRQISGWMRFPTAAFRFRPADAAARADKTRENNKAASQEENRQARNKAEASTMGTVHALEDGQPKAIRFAVGITDNRNTEVRGADI